MSHPFNFDTMPDLPHELNGVLDAVAEMEEALSDARSTVEHSMRQWESDRDEATDLRDQLESMTSERDRLAEQVAALQSELEEIA